MIRKTEIVKTAVLITSLAFLLLNLGFLCWYLFVGYQTGFHSDSAAKVLIAREIVELKDYFPDDWNYVNKDLFVLFGHTFVVPLLFFIPAGFLAHAISGLISSVLILSGVWFVTGIVQLSAGRRVLIVAIVAAGISGFMAENLYGQVSYGATLYFACYIFYFSWKYIVSEQGKKVVWGVALFLVLTLAFWANPERAMISYGLPLVAAILFLRINIENSVVDIKKQPFFSLFLVACLAILFGAGLHVLTISGVNNVLGAGHARWLSYELMQRNTGLLLKEFLAIFGGLPPVEGAVVCKTGIFSAIRFIAALILLVLMPVAIKRTFRQGNSSLLFLCAYALTSFMLVLFLQLATTIADMSDPIQSSRYLVPSLILLMLLVLMQPVDFIKTPLLVGSLAFLSIAFIASAYPALVASGSSSQLTWGMPGQRSNQKKALVDFLVQNGLHYGYATYWNAGVTSVLSDERVLVRQIVIDNGLPMPMRHLSSNRWYRPRTWKGETFLMLTMQESKMVDWDRFSAHRLKPVRELDFSGYKIYIFNENIAKKLPGWDWKYEEPTTITVSKYSHSQVGSLVVDFDQTGSALIAEKGEVGALHFGPFVNIEPGQYKVTFDVVAHHNEAGVVRLDVAASPDQKLYGEKKLQSSDSPQYLIITVDKTRTMEFRAWALGNERVVFRGVTVERLSEFK